MRVTQIPSIVAVVVMLLLAACGGAASSSVAESAPDASEVDTGGGDTGGGDTGGTNACLNTNEEVSAALGVEVTESENTSTPDGSASCIYYVDREAFEVAYTIGLSAPGAVAQQVFEAFKADDTSEPAAGVGDEALWYAGGLVIRTGDRVLSLGALNAEMDEAEIRAVLEDLGRKAVDRL